MAVRGTTREQLEALEKPRLSQPGSRVPHIAPVQGLSFSVAFCDGGAGGSGGLTISSDGIRWRRNLTGSDHGINQLGSTSGILTVRRDRSLVIFFSCSVTVRSPLISFSSVEGFGPPVNSPWDKL